MPSQTYSRLSFFVPPRNQGQIIEIAYAADGEREEIVLRLRDAADGSDGSVVYAVTRATNLVGKFEPWNSVPQFIDDELWSAVE